MLWMAITIVPLQNPELSSRKYSFTLLRRMAKRPLKADGESTVSLYYRNEYLATWDLTSGEGKINQVLLAMAETTGEANSKDERFHFVKAYILSSPKNIYEAISAGAVVMELCMVKHRKTSIR